VPPRGRASGPERRRRAGQPGQRGPSGGQRSPLRSRGGLPRAAAKRSML
jgi:hypothetical protein